jgi:hypothetical protein
MTGRFHWHWLPDASDARASHVAAVSRAVRSQGGDEVWWRFHRTLIDNEPWPFSDPGHAATRGFADDALVDYARRAGVSALYVNMLLDTHDASDRWAPLRTQVQGAHVTPPTLYAEGYTFGGYRRGIRKILDKLIAERSAAAK